MPCDGVHRYKLFNLAKTYNKNLTPGDVSGLASSVLLAGLAVPPYDAATGAATDAAAELERERTLRMASILGFSVVRNPPAPSWSNALFANQHGDLGRPSRLA